MKTSSLLLPSSPIYRMVPLITPTAARAAREDSSKPACRSMQTSPSSRLSSRQGGSAPWTKTAARARSAAASSGRASTCLPCRGGESRACTAGGARTDRVVPWARPSLAPAALKLSLQNQTTEQAPRVDLQNPRSRHLFRESKVPAAKMRPHEVRPTRGDWTRIGGRVLGGHRWPQALAGSRCQASHNPRRCA